MEQIQNLLEELRKHIEKVERMRIRLYKQSWLDDYNGRPGVEKWVYGIKITREDNEELLNLVTKMLRIVHDDPEIYADFVAVTEDGVYVQWHADAINPYGNPVGTTYMYEELGSVIRKFKRIESELPEDKELLKKFKEIVNNF